jgi:uncharacterized protein (TIGR04255 family)
MTSAQRNYKRPPITEAVIEVQFANPIDLKIIDDSKGIFEKHFPGLNTIAVTSLVPVPNAPAPAIIHSHTGFRMDNADSTDIISFTTTAFAYSRLAPYHGWAAFSAAALDWYGRLRKKIGFVPLKRVGLRYLNRLDIPVAPMTPIRLEDFITVEPRYPESELPVLQAFTMQTIHALPATGCVATITVASAVSPVPSHAGIIVDIDVARNESVPQSEDDIEILLETMRLEKNRIFELCITDATRELFNS